MKILFSLLFITLFYTIAFSQKTVEFRISAISSNIGDMDGFGLGDSDPQWDASISDGVTTGNFSLELSGTNCPGTVAQSNTFFTKAYNCTLPTNFTFQWRGFEDDGAGSDANTGLQNATINSSSLTSTTFTNVAVYTANATGTNCSAGTTVTWTITLQYRVTGSFLINTAPTGITPSSTIVLMGDNVTLNVNGGTTNIGAANFTWYTGACNSAPIGTGSSINYTVITPTTFYVNSVGTCATSCVSITIGTTGLGATVENIRHECNGEYLNVSFLTTNESNSDKFVLEKLDESFMEWEVISELKSQGYSTVSNNYLFSFIPSRTEVSNMYRLSEIDNDGQKTSYPIFSEVCYSEQTDWKIFPSPNNGTFQMLDPNPEAIQSIFNSIGNQVDFTIENNTIKLLNNESGFYYLIAVKNGKQSIHKFQVLSN